MVCGISKVWPVREYDPDDFDHQYHTKHHDITK